MTLDSSLYHPSDIHSVFKNTSSLSQKTFNKMTCRENVEYVIKVRPNKINKLRLVVITFYVNDARSGHTYIIASSVCTMNHRTSSNIIIRQLRLLVNKRPWPCGVQSVSVRSAAGVKACDQLQCFVMVPVIDGASDDVCRAHVCRGPDVAGRLASTLSAI